MSVYVAQSNIPDVPQTGYEKDKKKWKPRHFGLITAIFYATHFKFHWTYALPKERCRKCSISLERG
jgi:hypothetical protein